MKLGIVILAAGQGSRMRSRLPKVLHPLAGKPLLKHVIDCARQLEPEKVVVVYGHGGETVRESLDNEPVEWVEQAEQLGTGHALAQTLAATDGLDRVMVLYGDVPLIRPDTLRHLNERTGQGVGILTVELPDPTGYGRILRNDARHVVRIVEQKDASPEELGVREINSGIMSIGRTSLTGWLDRIGNDNAQGEYYLTDIIGLAVGDGVPVEGVIIDNATELMGINDRAQLAELEREYQRQGALTLMRQGVSLLDPARFDLRGRLHCGRDVTIDINVLIEGEVTLGDDVRIGANTVLRNSRIGDGVHILENCVIEDAAIGPDCRIGPFSRIRPGTELAGSNHVGNFVEIKKSRVDEGSKINHLSYVGDSIVGRKVNIGAGTITCNYDGANKHLTQIGDGAFIGSNTALVAPVVVGQGATIGAGSTISKEAPEGRLTLSRAKQITIEGWKRPLKEKK
ncbi:MAG: bifunctional UDP-N-acetylglucosamine diphosphorylase/glucosamine-1-phosphate N-acetyltransferase GlmU [Gammaproteobacteria bacterium]|nr:bifunctional UDP-N-acetylglucosamine diphosphorylase/glucosamine-1-phosphate N-acetyltransferase GlmU [Gammaproteobacteria bacterium]MBU1653777.1 bifunctional UDP-N-acetylglucosamine diphosphorylase/glucosamine-1-phosphate N-acetyltransferase GlmU [Gammaproteobacteria bacterium]MBU1962119.1 bifunctional UDP-N-acetylglucosamine diphosphorylase/glucosamine-1-phosphate N-acetyltransferase GlmU [Gammaproteobacteria bacterium]